MAVEDVEVVRLAEDGFSEDFFGGTSAARVTYIARGSSDELDVRGAVNATAPATHLGFWRLGMAPDHKGGGVWIVEVRYGVPPTTPDADLKTQIDNDGSTLDPGGSPPSAPGETDALGPEWSFSTMGGTEKRVTAVARVAAVYAAAVPAEKQEHKGQIGRKADGTYEGVEIPKPQFKFSTTRRVPAVSRKYLRTLNDLTGTVNDRVWWGWPVKCVMFFGAEGSMKNPAEGFTITYHWIGAKELRGSAILGSDALARLGFQFGNDVVKPGHAYLWFPVRQDAGKEVAYGAVIDEVFETRDLRKLGLGG